VTLPPSPDRSDFAAALKLTQNLGCIGICSVRAAWNYPVAFAFMADAKAGGFHHERKIGISIG
jgi:hypothetical protein